MSQRWLYVQLHRGMPALTDAHDQKVTHSYLVHFPEHEPREHDVHFRDFEAYKRRTKATAVCAIGEYRNDFSECHGHYGRPGEGLECHHSHIEFALQNSVDLAILEAHYPGVSNPDEVGFWVESGDNLEYLCTPHHRGHGGVHVASSSDYEAEKFIKGLIS